MFPSHDRGCHPVKEWSCTKYLDNYPIALTQCYFEGVLVEKIPASDDFECKDLGLEYHVLGYEDGEVIAECITAELLEEIAKQEYLDSLPVEEVPDDGPLVEFDGRTYNTNSEVTESDVLIDKINEMLETDAHCYQGTPNTTTAGIQNQRSFPIPTVESP